MFSSWIRVREATEGYSLQLQVTPPEQEDFGPEEQNLNSRSIY